MDIYGAIVSFVPQRSSLFLACAQYSILAMIHNPHFHGILQVTADVPVRGGITLRQILRLDPYLDLSQRTIFSNGGAKSMASIYNFGCHSCPPSRGPCGPISRRVIVDGQPVTSVSDLITPVCICVLHIRFHTIYLYLTFIP